MVSWFWEGVSGKIIQFGLTGAGNPKDYEPADAQRAISESVQWAAAKLEEMKAKLNLLYPWRTES